jgi:hypothetical protein
MEPFKRSANDLDGTTATSQTREPVRVNAGYSIRYTVPMPWAPPYCVTP